MRAAAGILVAAGLFLSGVLVGVGEPGQAGRPPAPVVLEDRSPGTGGGADRPVSGGGASPPADEAPLDVQEVQHQVEYGDVADYENEDAGDNSGPGGGEGSDAETGNSGPGSDNSGPGSDSSGSDSGSGSSGSGSSGSGGSGSGSGEPDHE